MLPLLLVALILGAVTSFVKPLLQILSIPFIIVTLGLFLLVINALMLMLTGWLAERSTSASTSTASGPPSAARS